MLIAPLYIPITTKVQASFHGRTFDVELTGLVFYSTSFLDTAEIRRMK